MQEDVDHTLWKCFITGDDGALNLLYRKFIDTLYSFGNRFTDDQELVKDAIQDLFVDLHKYRKTLSQSVNVKSYLLTSLKRKVSLLLRKKAAEQNRIYASSFSLETSMEDQHLQDDQQSELLSKLRRKVNLLPARQKEALYLRFNSELEYEEIAVIMDVSLSTCRTLVYRGVKQLREMMIIKHVYKVLA